MANRWGKSGSRQISFSWAPKSLQTVTAARKLRDACSLEVKCESKVAQSFQQTVQLFAIPWSGSWNSLGQNTGVGSLSLLQGIFPTQGLNPGLLHYRQILYQLSHREAQEYRSEQPICSPGNLPNPGIKPVSPALQVDSLPAELPGKPIIVILFKLLF